MSVFGLDSMIDERYSHLAVANSVAGFHIPYISSVQTRTLRAFLSVSAYSMVAQAGASSEAPVADEAGNVNPVWAATNHSFTSMGGSENHSSEVAIIMATIPTQSTAVDVVTPKVFEYNGKILTTSFDVAAYFQKTHDNVLKKIRSVVSDCDPEYHAVNFNEMFQEVEVANGAVRKSPYFELTRDAFVLIVMGFTGKRALQWKIDYINAFNRMEATLHGTLPALPNCQKDVVASRIMLALDCTGKVLFTEQISPDDFIGDIDKFRWFAEKLGYLVFKENELLAMLKGSKK